MREWIEDFLTAAGVVVVLYGTVFLLWMIEPLVN